MIYKGRLKLFFIGILAASIFVYLVCKKNQVTILGDASAPITLVYLHGLAAYIANPQEMRNRQLLDSIGKNLCIKIIAIPSPFRCKKFNNKLCWPHEIPEEMSETYNYIRRKVNIKNIAGYIGFSNGGFFLTQLMQTFPINKHIVIIGAGGFFNKNAETDVKSVTIIIGKQDHYHYAGAFSFAKQLKDENIQVTIIQHDGGHEIATTILQDVLKRLN